MHLLSVFVIEWIIGCETLTAVLETAGIGFAILERCVPELFAFFNFERLFGAAIFVLVAIDYFRFKRALVSGIGNTVFVIVRFGTAVFVLKAIDVFGLIGTLVAAALGRMNTVGLEIVAFALGMAWLSLFVGQTERMGPELEPESFPDLGGQ